MAAIEAINKTRLPADMKDRDRFVGVRVIRSGVKGQYFQARFSIRNALLADFGKPKRFPSEAHRRTATSLPPATISSPQSWRTRRSSTLTSR